MRPGFSPKKAMEIKSWTKSPNFWKIVDKTTPFFGIFILIDLIVSMFNLSENHSNIFIGLSVGIMVVLLSKIKYPKKP